ncbi:MAG: single-stranded DNA-binding protein [Clostridia bacterium]|nr:single-stranded DNA-binding protein [Clostridia bacterium]
MNKLTIIGNLTRDPELRTTSTGLNVCSFTVAVNRRRSANSNQPEADFFRVSAWRQLGENCQRYLAKGRKVCVIGPVSVSTYTANDGTTRASLEVTADDVEFLSSRNEDAGFAPAAPSQPAAAPPAMNGFEEVDDEDLPF